MNMKQFTFCLIFGYVLGIVLFSCSSDAKTLNVAVLDTGYDFDSTWPDAKKMGLKLPKICKTGHKDFTGTGLQDDYKHGTHIAGLIAKNAGNSDYCLTVLKYYDRNQSGMETLDKILQAWKQVLDTAVDIVNISGGGRYKSVSECELVTKILDKGTVIVAAAGNNDAALEDQGFYPAMCDKRVLIVENWKGSIRNPDSNYLRNAKGWLRVKENGEGVFSLFPKNEFGRMGGTSQSAAIVTGELIKTVGDGK